MEHISVHASIIPIFGLLAEIFQNSRIPITLVRASWWFSSLSVCRVRLDAGFTADYCTEFAVTAEPLIVFKQYRALPNDLELPRKLPNSSQAFLFAYEENLNF